MPFLLFLLSVATLVAVSSKSKAAAGGHTQTFTLDANLPEALRHQVIAALVSGTDPNAIDAFATAIQAQYPLSAGLLHAKATALRSGTPALPAASTDPGGPPLDATMPASMVAFVHTELLNETDPNKLVALANTLGAQYPIAAALLAQRAAVINVQPSGPPTPSYPPVVQPPPAPSNGSGSSAANPSAPALTIPGLDPGIPADLAQAVMTELATDTDPNRLQTYAQEIQSQYPMAASLLSAKSNSLIALAQSLTPPTPATPAAPSVPSTPTIPSTPFYPPPVTPAPVNPVVPVVAPPLGPSGSMLGMDANMPPQTVQLVLSELTNEQDPTKLQALAAQLAPQYPIAAGLLNTRANVLLATQPPATIVPSPSTTPTTVASTYIVQQDDFPWKIAAHLTGHGARWPELVAANPQKPKGKDGNFTTLLPGEKLNLPTSWVASPSPAPGAVATTDTSRARVPGAVIAPTPDQMVPGPPPPSPSPPASPSSALDPGIPANVASAVLAAVKTGTDPAQLRGFASALSKEGFPIASALLNAKASTLDPPPGAGPAPAPGQATPLGPAPGGAPAATYKVKAGDSPSKIAHALVHDGNRWTELVAANPQKKRAKDGNFATLMPGEVLQLPASWVTSAAPPAAHLPQGGA